MHAIQIPDELIQVLAAARHVAVLTGAGISAESGVPTFRDAGGLWQKFRPEELASMDGFLRNPDLVWEWYQARRQVIHHVEPNAGHYALADIERMVPAFTLATQNIDRLHQRAGSVQVYELHGNIVDNYCMRCKQPHEYAYSDDTAGQTLPRCTYCGGLIRPAVVWFGEMLPEDALLAAQQAALECDVFFSIGTSAEVYPAAQLPLHARESGAYLVEINPNPTHITPFADAALHAPSGMVLPQIAERLQQYLADTTTQNGQ